MPFSSGVYTAPASNWNPAVAGTTIDPAIWNAQLSDFSTALSTCLLKDGTQTATASIPFAANITVGVAGSAQGTVGFRGATSGTTTLSGSAVAGAATLTLPAATDTLVGRATTDTLTNKTLTSPVMTTPTLGVASATSINFGGNALASYVEGSWTPAIAGSSVAGTQTYTVQLGRYIRIGNIVHAWFRCSMSAKDGATSGALIITGLPLVSSTIATFNWATTLNWDNIDLDAAGGYTCVVGFVGSNQSQINLNEAGDNNTRANLTEADLANTSAFIGSVTYRTA